MTDRVLLAHLPTPIEELPRLSKMFAGPSLFIKRDDLTGLGFGGNKTRKLEYLAADALANGCQTLISTGAEQSNHCRQVAAAAARLGLGCILVLAGDKPQKNQGNLFLDLLSGAEVVFVSKDQRDQALAELTEQAHAQNRKPYQSPTAAQTPSEPWATARQCANCASRTLPRIGSFSRHLPAERKQVCCSARGKQASRRRS